MSPFIGEFIGTALLITMGDGVVANVLLNKTKGNNSGLDRYNIWLGHGCFYWRICFHTLLAASGHLNPAVTIALSVYLVILIHSLIAYLSRSTICRRH